MEARQRVLGASIECVFTFDASVDLGSLDLNIGEQRLELTSGDTGVAVTWAREPDDQKATAKLSRKKGHLIVSAPLARPEEPRAAPAERHVRLTVPRRERGTHCLVFRDAGPFYALVSKSGEPCRCDEPSSYSWAATFDAGASGAAISIDTGKWLFESADACVLFGRLGPGDTPPALIESWRALLGVRIEALGPATDDGGADAATAADTIAFLPEREQLATVELRRACLWYDAAYRGLESGHDISTREKPSLPVPRWLSTDAASTGGGGSGGDGDARETRREVRDEHRVSLTYGEAHFAPLHALLSRVGVRRGDVLVDLGSGTGRVVLGAALAFPALGQARGYELLPGLHAAALEAHSRLLGGDGSGGSGGSSVGGGEGGDDGHGMPADGGAPPPCAPVAFAEGDFLAAEWSDADVLFATSLCFPHELSVAVERRARRLKPGARVVVMSHDFGAHDEASEGFFAPRRDVRDEEPRHALEVEMDFGDVLFYVFERTDKRE